MSGATFAASNSGSTKLVRKVGGFTDRLDALEREMDAHCNLLRAPPVQQRRHHAEGQCSTSGHVTCATRRAR
jgi:hypothetical protein